uniref:Uncharacterized protein n=1 Tax=Oryza nivara TaxID=4536 RepID=A0A0E0II04_ORYNI
MTSKSRCSRTVKDKTSHQVCQTRGQLGTNVRAGVANTARARQGTTMNHTPMSEETSREGLRDGRGARTAVTTVAAWRCGGDARSRGRRPRAADDDQCRRRGCRCANGDEDDESGEAAVREDNTAAAPYRCSGEKSTGDVAMLRRAPLSTATTSGGMDHRRQHCGPRGRRSGNPKFDGVDVCSMTIGCRSRCSRAPERVIKPKMHGTER